MTTLTTIDIEPPYLLFIGDMDYELDAKTAFGIAYWRPELFRRPTKRTIGT